MNTVVVAEFGLIIPASGVHPLNVHSAFIGVVVMVGVVLALCVLAPDGDTEAAPLPARSKRVYVAPPSWPPGDQPLSELSEQAINSKNAGNAAAVTQRNSRFFVLISLQSNAFFIQKPPS